MVQTGLKFKSAVDVKIDKGKVSLTELTRNDPISKDIDRLCESRDLGLWHMCKYFFSNLRIVFQSTKVYERIHILHS